MSLTEKRVIAGIYLAGLLLCAANVYLDWNLFGSLGKKILAVVTFVGVLCMHRFGPAMLQEIEDYRASQKQKSDSDKRV